MGFLITVVLVVIGFCVLVRLLEGPKSKDSDKATIIYMGKDKNGEKQWKVDLGNKD